MKVKDYFKLLREIKSVAFSTVDQYGKPQVRIIDIMIVEDEKIYFVSARGKEFYRELTEQKQVALVGLTKDYQSIRVSGEIKKLETAWIDRVFEENKSMNEVYPGESRYILDAFCIYRGNGEYFDLSSSPIYRESFSFGKEEIQLKGFQIKGFQIEDSCISCGRCKASCPQQCIEEGSPYVIEQSQCLHCGLCFEICPVRAIRHRKEL